MSINRIIVLVSVLIFISGCQCRICENTQIKKHCWQKLLTDELENDSPWVQIHSAEYLLDLNLELETVREHFLKHDQKYSGQEFLRNGHNRILVRLNSDSERRLSEIHARAFLDEVPDKFSATETLGKLYYKGSKEDLIYLKKLRYNSEADELMRYMSAWIIDDNDSEREAFLVSALSEQTANKLTPTIGVWGLYYIKKLQNPETFSALQKALLNSNLPPEARMLAGELLLKYGKISFQKVADVKQSLDKLPENDRSWLYRQAWCQVLLYADDAEFALTELNKYLKSDNPELRIVAALILLKRY
ncbi:MAG: hypothetical protein IKD09_06895 [Lentisphaeria bacterium]|nr:hypothetical protein [Lentisphaeria bacterium]